MPQARVVCGLSAIYDESQSYNGFLHTPFFEQALLWKIQLDQILILFQPMFLNCPKNEQQKLPKDGKIIEMVKLLFVPCFQ